MRRGGRRSTGDANEQRKNESGAERGVLETGGDQPDCGASGEHHRRQPPEAFRRWRRTRLYGAAVTVTVTNSLLPSHVSSHPAATLCAGFTLHHAARACLRAGSAASPPLVCSVRASHQSPFTSFFISSTSPSPSPFPRPAAVSLLCSAAVVDRSLFHLLSSCQQSPSRHAAVGVSGEARSEGVHA